MTASDPQWSFEAASARQVIQIDPPVEANELRSDPLPLVGHPAKVGSLQADRNLLPNLLTKCRRMAAGGNASGRAIGSGNDVASYDSCPVGPLGSLPHDL